MEELGRQTVVGHNAADPRGGHEDEVRLLIGVKAAHGRGVAQVQFGLAAADQMPVSLAHEFAPDGAANQTTMAGDVNPCIVRKLHCAERYQNWRPGSSSAPAA